MRRTMDRRMNELTERVNNLTVHLTIEIRGESPTDGKKCFFFYIRFVFFFHKTVSPTSILSNGKDKSFAVNNYSDLNKSLFKCLTSKLTTYLVPLEDVFFVE